MRNRYSTIALATCCAVLCAAAAAHAQVAVRGKTVYTMAGRPITDGVVVVKDGKIVAIGTAAEVKVPDGARTLTAAVVTPGLIDAHATVGFSGILNQPQDQDQLERSTAIQPELRAVDAYNAQDELVEWIRGFGVTTVHTGHAPGELISGQTMIVKTVGHTVADAVVRDAQAVAATLSIDARKTEGKSPGTRGKMMAMLRSELLKAREYAAKQRKAAEKPDKPAGAGAAPAAKPGETADTAKKPAEPPPRDLRMETLGQVLDGKLVLLVTADRVQDIQSALRLAKEFGIKLWLDGAAEAYLAIDDIKAAGVPVIIHPTMARAVGDKENQSFETAAKLVAAGIPVALQSGYEAYVPKTRVVLFEAGLAAANGLSFEQALATITIDAAKILGIADRVGSIEIGKDGDLALYDGDPFEYTSHCVGVVIDGKVASERKQ
ncbi:MAG: amidohydrolase family protein [Planctomycetia bacterium]|nr:amidohydrolase family protein [Planctomycetia bacterium]